VPLSEEQQKKIDDIGLELDSRNNPRANINRASFLNPDQQAEVIALSESRRLPLDTVENNLGELKRRQQVESINITGYPRLSSYLADDKNSRVSIDDLDSLKGLEDTIRQSEHGYWSNVGRGALNRVNQLTGNLLQGVGNLGKDFERFMVDDLGMPNPGITIGEDGVSWSWNMPTEIPSLIEHTGRAISEGEAFKYQPRFTWERFKGDMNAKTLAGYIAEQGIKSVPDMLAAVYTLPAYIGSRTEEIAEARVANDERQDVTTSDLATSLIPAVATALMERIGGKIVLGTGGIKTFKDALKATGGAAVIEGGTEFLQEGIEYLGETVGTKKDISMAEMVDRQLAGLVAGAGMGAGIRGTTSSVEALANRTGRNVKDAIVSMSEQEIIDDIVTYSQSSKTRQRISYRFKNFVQELKAQKQVHISSEGINESILAGIELPAYIMEQMNGLGADIIIDIDQFSTDIAANEELMSIIRPHLKLNSDSLTQNQMEFDEDLTIKALLEKAEKSQELKTEAEEIYETVKDQLVATGRQSETTARYSAAIIPAYATVKAEQTGKTVKEIYEMMGLTTVGPATVPVEDGVVLDQVITKSTESGISYHQNFKDITFKDKKIISTTGEEVTIEQSAQKLWDRNIKRKDQIVKLKDCINAN